MDFGLAKVADRRNVSAGATLDVTLDDPNLTSPGIALGTVAYMSPEQALGTPLDARSDLFSLGLTLYEMATGKQAFSGTTSAAIFDAILHSNPPPPERVNPALPAALNQILSKLIEKDPDLRYQTAADLRADLKRLHRDTTSGHTAVATVAAEKRKNGVPRWAWLTIGAVVLVVAAAAIWFYAAAPTKYSGPPSASRSVHQFCRRQRRTRPFTGRQRSCLLLARGEQYGPECLSLIRSIGRGGYAFASHK